MSALSPQPGGPDMVETAAPSDMAPDQSPAARLDALCARLARGPVSYYEAIDTCREAAEAIAQLRRALGRIASPGARVWGEGIERPVVQHGWTGECTAIPPHRVLVEIDDLDLAVARDLGVPEAGGAPGEIAP